MRVKIALLAVVLAVAGVVGVLVARGVGGSNMRLVWSSDTGGWNQPGMVVTSKAFYETAKKTRSFIWEVSPDGKKCLFWVRNHGRDKFMILLRSVTDGRQEGILLPDTVYPGSPEAAQSLGPKHLWGVAWHGDDAISMLQYVDGKTMLWDWEPGEGEIGAAKRRLLEGVELPSCAGLIQWRPQGDMLALSFDATDGVPQGQVLVAEPDKDEKVKTIFSKRDTYPRYLSWSPSGEALVFLEHRRGQVYLWRPGMEEARVVFDLREWCESGSAHFSERFIWSPDEKEICSSYEVYKMSGWKSPQLLIFDLESGEARRIKHVKKRYGEWLRVYGLFDWAKEGGIRFLHFRRDGTGEVWEVRGRVEDS